MMHMSITIYIKQMSVLVFIFYVKKDFHTSVEFTFKSDPYSSSSNGFLLCFFEIFNKTHVINFLFREKNQIEMWLESVSWIYINYVDMKILPRTKKTFVWIDTPSQFNTKFKERSESNKILNIWLELCLTQWSHNRAVVFVLQF